MQATTATPRPGASGTSPLSKRAAYDWLFSSSSSVADMVDVSLCR